MTVRSFRPLITVAIITYLISPVIVGGGLYYELQAGAFPPEADGIAIPFMGFLVLWFAGMIVAAVVLACKAAFSTKDGDLREQTDTAGVK